uniref:Ras-associating domain-containing protein n=1 Tax=Steinernema glaseri TaxID=37863 RepID=A0A1I7YIP6_9BILA
MMVPARILPQAIVLEDVPGAGYCMPLSPLPLLHVFTAILPGDFLYDDSENSEPLRMLTSEELKRGETSESVLHRISQPHPSYGGYKLTLKNVDKTPNKIKVPSGVLKSRL